jgi:hypothetical protein
MLPIILALALPATIAEWAILLIIVCAVVGIAVVVIKQTGVVIPAFVWTILWIVLAAALGIVAIRFLMGL